MVYLTSYRSLIFLLVVFCVNFSFTLCDCGAETVYAIQNGDWVLDLTNSDAATISAYDGSEEQQFLIECASEPGLFYITNKATGKRLDVQRISSIHGVLSREPDDTFWQQWFLNGSGHIYNAAVTGYLAVADGTFEDGSPVEVFRGDAPSYQLWTLVEV